MSNFSRCDAIRARIEGGYSKPKPGDTHPTLWGVTEETFHAYLLHRGQPLRPVREMTVAECQDIYFTEYWTPSGAEALAWPLSVIHYDLRVNSNPKWSIRFLKEFPNDPAGYLNRRKQLYDGIIALHPEDEVDRNGWYNRLWCLGNISDPVVEAQFVKTGRYPKRPAGILIFPVVHVP